MNQTRLVLCGAGLVFLVALPSGSEAGVVHHWRFEGGLDWLDDSVGTADLISAGVDQATLPSSGRGADFPSEVGGAPNASAAELDAAADLLTTTNVTIFDNDFTVEAFIHVDSLTPGEFGPVIAGPAVAGVHPSSSWILEIRTDGAGGTAIGELALFTYEGAAVITSGSGIIISAGIDYYVAALFDLGAGEVTFHVEELSSETRTRQQTTASHSIATLNNPVGVPFTIGNAEHFSGEFLLDGLVDEVRVSNSLLSPIELLVPPPEVPALGSVIGSLLSLAGRDWCPRIASAGWRRPSGIAEH